MPIRVSIAFWWIIFLSSGVQADHQETSQLKLDQASWWADLAINGNDFGEQHLRPGQKLNVNVQIVNNGTSPITISSISESGKKANIKDFFIALNESSSTCFNKKDIAVGDFCNIVINVIPDSQEKVFNKRLFVRYSDKAKNIYEQEFTLNGTLKIDLNTVLFGDASFTSVDSNTSSDDNSQPILTYALANNTDPWFPYLFRPSIDEAVQKKLYSEEILRKIPSLTRLKALHVPWTFLAQPDGPKELQKLVDVVPDRIVDPKTGKRYVKLYHGTTDDIIDIFKAGEKAIRYDVAVTTVLGQGFYLAANPNEAKAYACTRLKDRIKNKPGLKGLMLVVGVLEDEIIKGKFSLKVHLSDDKTGDPLDPEIYFKRNGKLMNQFVFFSNIKPYIKMFEIVSLPLGFGKSAGVDDYDGLTEANKDKLAASHYKCIF